MHVEHDTHCRSTFADHSVICCHIICRYMGLSQTWRKFFCVLAPRETVAGYATEMQLLVFSKNGFDPVTKVLMTNAAPIQVPLKAAHGLACFELVHTSACLPMASHYKMTCVAEPNPQESLCWTSALLLFTSHQSRHTSASRVVLQRRALTCGHAACSLRVHQAL